MKCMHCVYSCPTGTMGGFKCDLADCKEKRQMECEKALYAMRKYNEIRSMKDKENSNERIY